MREDLLTKALHIQDPWIIKDVTLDKSTKRLDISIGFKNGETFYYKDPETGEDGEYKVYDTKKKTWQHLSFFENKCFIHARVPRVKIGKGNVRLVTVPWAGVMAGFTKHFESHLVPMCCHMPINRVSKITGTTDYKLWTMLDKYVDKSREHLDFSDVTVIGIDETSQRRGHKYISLFVDLKKKEQFS